MMWSVALLLTAIPSSGIMPPASAMKAGECSVSGSAGHRADEARALAACAWARARFSELFGEAAPRAHVTLHAAPQYEVALVDDTGVVFWPNSAMLAGASQSWQERQWSDVLPHELMHALTMAYFFAGENAVDPVGYGTPLPDWFEEGIAIWGEPESSRKGRLAQARLLPAERLNLTRILGGRHPVAADPGILASVPGASVPHSDELRTFYPQSIAVVAYVHARGGTEAMRELGRRLHAAPARRDVLAGLPGLPETLSEIEADWQKWLGAGRVSSGL
jgi:hypothetical protein